MDEDEKNRAAARRDAFLRELERRSLDTIMVYNPTEKDYMLEWDKRYHRIPSKNHDMGFGPGKMELSRYLAEKYAREMKNLLVNIASDQFMDEFRKERERIGQKLRDKFEENNEALPLVPKTNDAQRIKEIYNMIILGVVREYGMDTPEEQPGEIMDTKTPEEKALENLDRPYNPSDSITMPEEVLSSTEAVSTPSTGTKSEDANKRKMKAVISEVSK